MSLLELFCDIDDFCQIYEPSWHQPLLETGQRTRLRRSRMSMSEMMTIVIHFHQKRYRDFKTYYSDYVVVHLRGAKTLLVNWRIKHPVSLGSIFEYERVFWSLSHSDIHSGSRRSSPSTALNSLKD